MNCQLYYEGYNSNSVLSDMLNLLPDKVQHFSTMVNFWKHYLSKAQKTKLELPVSHKLQQSFRISFHILSKSLVHELVFQISHNLSIPAFFQALESCSCTTFRQTNFEPLAALLAQVHTTEGSTRVQGVTVTHNTHEPVEMLSLFTVKSHEPFKRISFSFTSFVYHSVSAIAGTLEVCSFLSLEFSE